MTMDIATLAHLSEREQVLIARAASHVLADDAAGDSRFRKGVTDLDAARLIHRIERGALIVPSATGRSWHEVPRGPHMPPLTRVIEECLRLGLVERLSVETAPAIWRTQLQAAPVHIRTTPGAVLCGKHSRAPGKRLRALRDATLADCAACVHLHG